MQYYVVGSGIFLRDCHGDFVAARSNVQQCSLLDPAIADAMCFREALSLLKDRNSSIVKVESYALVVMHAINHNKVDNS